MKRNLAAAAVIVIGVLIVLQVSTFAKTTKPTHAVSGPITIQVWNDLIFSQTGLSASGTACFKLNGALDDRGGGPTWNDANFEDKTSPASKCSNWEPSGVAVAVPPAGGSNLYSIIATGTFFGRKGDLDVSFAAGYNLTTTFTGSGSWVITGGTGAYAGARGQGTFSGNLRADPYQWLDLTGTLRLKHA